MLFVFNSFKPLNHGGGVFLLVEFGCSRDVAVDSVEGYFADFAYLGFSRIDQSAGRFVSEVWFVVLHCYKCVLVSSSVYSVINTQLRCDFFVLCMDVPYGLYIYSYATLLLGYLENKLYSQVADIMGREIGHYVYTNWRRFLDDCYINQPYGGDKLEQLQHILNSIDSNIQLTAETSCKELPFLDVMIRKEKTCLTFTQDKHFDSYGNFPKTRLSLNKFSYFYFLKDNLA